MTRTIQKLGVRGAMPRRARSRRSQLAMGLLAGLTLAVATAGPAIAAAFTVTELGTLGGTFSVAYGINDLGQVVGDSATAGGATHAFLWQSGTMTDLGTLSAAGGDSHARSINDLGQVVGSSTTAGGAIHAFLWQSGTMTDLNSLIPADSGWVLVEAAAINEAGQIVGWGTNGGQPRAFLWQTGTVTDLGTLGGNSSSASAINDVGQVVGSSATADGFFHAFLWQNGTMIDLGTLNPAGGDSSASGINNLGQVVGNSAPEFFDEGGFGPLPHAFLWQNGWMADLHNTGYFPGSFAHESYAMGINDAGLIVGAFSVGIFRAFPADLQSLIPADSGLVLDAATAINNAGQIVGAGGPGTRAFLLTPSPLASLSLNPTTVPERSPSTGTVTLTTAAPEGGAVIGLSSSNTAIATVPATVIVPAGAVSATFTVSTNSVSASTSVTISATYGGFTGSAVLTVAPATTLAAISLNPTTLIGGTDSTGAVTLSARAPAGGVVVALSTNNVSVATLPSGVTVPAGATSASFTVSTNSVSASTSVTISGTYGGITRSAPLTVAPAATLSAISLTMAAPTAGNPSTGTVTLSAPAPAGGAAVTLSSSNVLVATVPAGVTVPAGATTASFTVSAVACTSGAVTISGSYGGVIRSAMLTVTLGPTDTVTIQQADYFASKQELRVAAKSNSSTKTLHVYVTSTGELIGTLRYRGDGKYSGQFAWPVNPQKITVRSSRCGSATKAVTSR